MLSRGAALLTLAAGAAALTEDYVRTNAGVMFADFQRDYGRQYATGEERSQRLAIFTANMLNAARLEIENPDATFGVNGFSDMSPDEFKVYHTGFVPTASHANFTAPVASEDEVLRAEASDIDWRKKGAVTSVKNQAQCGSCWAFSAICAIEGGWYVAGNSLTSLSEQELVSCGPGNGCGGGDMSQAISWVKSHGGVNAEKAYPYTSGGGSTGSCNSAKSKVAVAKVESSGSGGRDEGTILTNLGKHGPLSIGVDAGSFQSYRGGVMSSCNGRSLDHGVAIIGYSSSGKYWIVRNSWGASWGESGYIRLKYGSDQCGMTKEVTYSASHSAGPPPPPVPPDAARYHCDKDAKQCIVATAGHSDASSCITACSSPVPPAKVRYHCDKTGRYPQCVVADSGHSTVATCLSSCKA